VGPQDLRRAPAKHFLPLSRCQIAEREIAVLAGDPTPKRLELLSEVVPKPFRDLEVFAPDSPLEQRRFEPSVPLA
jgi:hypothetical protein